MSTQKLPRVILAQYATRNVEYFKYTCKVNKYYCSAHGLEYVTEQDDVKIRSKTTDQNRSVLWYKPEFILDVMCRYEPDYVFFLDADAMILNFDIGLDNTGRPLNIYSFIHPIFDITAAKDASPPKFAYSTYINTGSLLLKNTEKVRKFLVDWASSYLRYPESLKLKVQDQSGFCLTLDEDAAFKASSLLILEDVLFNSQKPTPSCFVYHAWRNKDNIKVEYDKLVSKYPDIAEQ